MCLGNIPKDFLINYLKKTQKQIKKQTNKQKTGLKGRAYIFVFILILLILMIF